jgi:lipopolysaccharide/colanic/teichoic acid biosynthesis glycosyltransferase
MRIFHVILPVRVSGLLFSEFLLTISCYLTAIAVEFRGGTLSYLVDERGLLRLLLVSVSLLVGLFVNNLYSETRVDSRVLLVLKMCNVVGIALVVQGLLTYVTSGLGMPRLAMLVGTGIGFVALVSWRIFYGNVFLRMIGTHKILFVGKDELMDAIAERIHLHPEQGFTICGYVAYGQESEGDAGTSAVKRIGSGEELAEVIARVEPDRIVVATQDKRGGLPIALLLNLVRNGVQVEEAAAMYESTCGRVSSRELSASQIIFRNELASRPGSLALQSVYANLVGITAFVTALPLLILSAVAVKLTSRGPIFEQDTRVGQHGIPFNLNRFRCHQVGKDNAYGSLEASLTPVGRWLQKLHLVHLPRVINLVRGEITLVGPRPERPEFVEELSTYFSYYGQRHSVKPGITGWSQINTPKPGKRVDTLMQLEYDLYYTKNISLALDAYILLHEIRQVLPFSHV